MVAGHATSTALLDEKDVFLCDDLKLSPPSTIEPSGQVVELHPQFRGSHLTIIEKTEVVPQPLPSAPSAPSTFLDVTVPLKDQDSAASDVVRNPSLEQFPSLAAPSPLRKSIRNPRESSLEPSLTTTPGAGLTGNHTSWLAKVREAKAMEVMNKRASVAPSALVAPLGGMKRKSGELSCGLANDGDNGEERQAKILKASMDDTEAAIHLEPQPPGAPSLQLSVADVHAEGPQVDVTTSRMDSETDMMAPLKKAIETLRARTGKSLAGNLMEMNPQDPSPVDLEEVLNGGLPQPHTLRPSTSAPISIHGKAAAAAIIRAPTPPRLSQPVAEPTIVPPFREESKRLSISDLVPKHDSSNTTSRTSSNETSISTTPPDSPPVTKKTAFFVPGGPVFNKPPPVFIPPPTMKSDRSPSGISTNVPKAHVSQLPGHLPTATFGLGLQPTKLPRSPPRGPFSAQSTQSSSFSDHVFGTQDDTPGWMPRSQDTQMTSQGSQPVDEVKGRPAGIDDDDDDSWPIDSKFGATNAFAGIAAVEDSMTWSTAPSESQIGSQSLRQDSTGDTMDAAIPSSRSQIGSDELDEDMDVDEDIKGDVLDEGKPTISLVTVSRRPLLRCYQRSSNILQANHAPTKSQHSVASSSGESSQPVGFFGHATKLVSSMLGVSKKNKAEPPKSIQLAATAAKKVTLFLTFLVGLAIKPYRWPATGRTGSQNNPFKGYGGEKAGTASKEGGGRETQGG